MVGDCGEGDDVCAADHRVRQDGSGLHESPPGRPDYALKR